MSQPPTRTSPPSKIYRFSSNLPGPSPLSDGIHLCNRCTVTTCRLWLLPRDLHHLRGRLGVKMQRKWKVIVATRDHAIMQYGYIIYICYIYILYLFTYLKFETLDNFDPPHLQISKFSTSSKGWDGWTKQIKPPKIKCHARLLEHWDLGSGVACHSSSKGLNIWSIYCMMAYKAYHIPIEYISWDMCSIAMHRWIVETWRMHIMHNSWWYLVRQNMPFKKLLLYVTYNLIIHICLFRHLWTCTDLYLE